VFDVSRALVARLLNASPAEIALAFNTSYGLNLAARGLPLAAGDVIVASDREFPANVYPWLRLQDRGVRLELVPVTAEGWPDEQRLLDRMSDPAVRVVAVSLVQFSNGYQVDLARLSARARETDTFLVLDAIQGLGRCRWMSGRPPWTFSPVGPRSGCWGRGAAASPMCAATSSPGSTQS
jgi:selenocysteine lyase/cysteine desulfurase